MSKEQLLDYANQFVLEPTLRRAEMSESYKRSFVSIVERLCEELPDDINEGDELELRTRKFLLGIMRDGREASTCKLYAITLSRFFERYYLFNENNKRRLCDTFSYSPNTTSDKSIEVEELRSIFKRLRERGQTYTCYRDYMLTGVGALTGMRVSQIVGLTLPAIDEHDGGIQLTTRRQKNKSQEETVKVIPPDALLPDGLNFSELMTNYLRLRGKHVVPESLYLFPKCDGSPLSTDYVRKFLRKYADIHPHQLRHTVGTLISRTSGLVQAAEILDHANIQTTMRYVKVDSKLNSAETIRKMTSGW